MAPRLRFSRRAVPRPPRPALVASSADTRPRASVAALAAQQVTVAESLACGAVARTVQVVAMYPVDTIKTRVQFSRAASLGALARLRDAVVAGQLWRGTAPSLLGQIPYGMVTFGALEAARSALRERFPNAPNWSTTAVAATIGDLLGSLLLTPSEVIKQKTQAGVSSGAASAARSIFKTHGPGGFYQGFGSSLSRDVPFRIFQFGFFEAWKAWYADRVKRAVTPIENLLIGACAGTSSAAITTPLDVVRTRMMAQTVGSPGAFKNGLDCAIKTISLEGPAAMFRGLAPRCMLIAPSSAIFFLAYEAAKGFFQRRQARKAKSFDPKLASARGRSHAKAIASVGLPKRVGPALCGQRGRVVAA